MKTLRGLLPARSRRGQILIPSFFVIPSLFLFVFIVFETAKLSREKIRHQFAVDSASFIEMTNYSDFLNRSAYVNGAFPERIFAESFFGTCIPSKNAVSGSGSPGDIKTLVREGCGMEGNLFKILWKNNAFPARDSVQERNPPSPDEGGAADRPWKINYFDLDYNQPPPKNAQCPLDGKDKCAYILTSQDALDWWIQWEDAQDIYKLYFQIYQLLGSVYEAQLAVFNRLTKDSAPASHTFYRKSVWLNTGETGGDFDNWAETAVNDSFKTRLDSQFQPKAHCVQYILFYGNQYTPTAYQPYKIYSPDQSARVSPLTKCEGGDGLFQVAYAKNLKGIFNSLPTGETSPLGIDKRGIPVRHVWRAPDNYWNVKWNSDPIHGVRCDDGDRGPCVHSTISLTAADGSDPGGRLWPDPTPKFQTRLYP